MVAGIVLMFAFTFSGLVWLARDVDRGVSNRSAAQSIAFQAARSGAQATSIGEVRGGTDIATIDVAEARNRAATTAASLFASYGVAGRVTAIAVDVDSVSVSVEIVDDGLVVTGAGIVRAERAP